MTRFVLIMILISAAGCSTVHLHKGFYLNKDKTSGKVTSNCASSPGDYGEPIKLELDSKKYRVFVWPKHGFSFMGPIFVPFIPQFWISSQINSLGIKVIPEDEGSSTNVFDLKKWYIILDDGIRIFPKLGDMETLDGGAVVKNIGGGVWLIFEFPTRSVPDEITLYVPSTLKPTSEATQKIAFQRNSRWHYVPFVFMHTEWPYTHHLPCNRD